MTARIAAVVLLALSAPVALGETGASSEAKGRKPVITTDIIFSTVELLTEISDHAYNALLASHVSKHAPVLKAHVDKTLDLAFDKLKVKKEDVVAKIDAARAAASDIKANVAAHKEIAQEKLNGIASNIVDSFEKAFPTYAGLLSRTIGDLVLTGLYFAFVFYTLLRIVFGVFRLVIKTFSFFCCCGFCRRSKGGVDAKAAKDALAAKKVKGPATTPASSKPANKKK